MKNLKNYYKILESKISKIKTKKFQEAIEPLGIWGNGAPTGGLISQVAAPINRAGQWKIIAGLPGTGKSSLLRQEYDYLVSLYGVEGVAVLAIGERPEEIQDIWSGVLKLYSITSEDGLSSELHHKLCATVYAIAVDSKIRAVIIDSLSGMARIIRTHPSLDRDGMDAGGMKSSVPEYIEHYIIRALKTRPLQDGYTEDRVIVSSLLYGEDNRSNKTLFESLRAYCDSEVILDYNKARKGLFPAVDLGKSFSRKENKFLSEEALSLLKNLRELGEENFEELIRVLS